jgi:hypothetical protein
VGKITFHLWLKLAGGLVRVHLDEYKTYGGNIMQLAKNIIEQLEQYKQELEHKQNKQMLDFYRSVNNENRN